VGWLNKFWTSRPDAESIIESPAIKSLVLRFHSFQTEFVPASIHPDIVFVKITLLIYPNICPLSIQVNPEAPAGRPGPIKRDIHSSDLE
jgi:hypothetical protein